MKRSPRVLIVVVAAALLFAAMASPVQADPYDATYGDLNGDGYKDRVQVVESDGAYDGTSLCALDVSYGKSEGGYEPALRETYDLWDAYRQPPNCPELAVISDLGGDGQSEIVLTWWCCSPYQSEDERPSLGEIIVLNRSFERVGQYHGEDEPLTIGTKDFNGDGRMDIWSVTDQGGGLQTYFSDENGALYPGHVSLCNEGTPPFEFADFDRDGGMDVVGVVDENACWELPAQGVVVVDGKTGVQTSLRRLAAGEEMLTPHAVEINGDVYMDVRVLGWAWEGTSADPVEVSRTDFINNGSGGFKIRSTTPTQPSPTPTGSNPTPTPAGSASAPVPTATHSTPTPTPTVTVTFTPGTGNPQSTSPVIVTPPPGPPPVQVKGIARKSFKIAYVRWNSPGRDTTNNASINGEKVRIRNVSETRRSLRGFTITDATGVLYTFPKTSLAPGERVTVFSGRGKPAPGKRYWGLYRHILGNKRDKVTLYDRSQRILDTARWTRPGSGGSTF